MKRRVELAGNIGLTSAAGLPNVQLYEDDRRDASGLDRENRKSAFAVQVGGFDLIELAASSR